MAYMQMPWAILISKTLTARYFQDGNIFETSQRSSDLFAWKSMCSVMDIFKNGIEGNADDCNSLMEIWNDRNLLCEGRIHLCVQLEDDNDARSG